MTEIEIFFSCITAALFLSFIYVANRWSKTKSELLEVLIERNQLYRKEESEMRATIIQSIMRDVNELYPGVLDTADHTHEWGRWNPGTTTTQNSYRICKLCRKKHTVDL